MKIKVSSASMILNNPGVQMEGIWISFHKDSFGESSSFRLSNDRGAKAPLGIQMLDGTDLYDQYYKGVSLWDPQPGDLVEVETGCSLVTARVEKVEGGVIRLKEVVYDGPWANFRGWFPDAEAVTNATFGRVIYEVTGLETVEASGFCGDLDSYFSLRQQEESAPAYHSAVEAEICRRQAGRLSDPDQEKSFQIAEALGLGDL